MAKVKLGIVLAALLLAGVAHGQSSGTLLEAEDRSTGTYYSAPVTGSAPGVYVDIHRTAGTGSCSGQIQQYFTNGGWFDVLALGQGTMPTIWECPYAAASASLPSSNANQCGSVTSFALPKTWRLELTVSTANATCKATFVELR